MPPNHWASDVIKPYYQEMLSSHHPLVPSIQAESEYNAQAGEAGEQRQTDTQTQNTNQITAIN